MILLDWLRQCRKSRSRKVRLGNNLYATRCDGSRSVERLEDRCLLTVFDLRSSGATAAANGAIYHAFNGFGSSAGTGSINSFLAMSDKNDAGEVEQGYNTNADPSTDPSQFEVDNSKTSALRWNDDPNTPQIEGVPLVNIGGVRYREFALDINESNPCLSLDKVEIYITADANLGGGASPDYPFNNTVAPLVYSLDAGGDNTIVLDQTVAGSGGGLLDMTLFVPDSLFNDATKPYVVLFAEMGATVNPGVTGNPACGAEGGFEEWAVGNGRSITGTIKGYKFRDDNNNTTQDFGEPRLADVTIFLDADGDNILDIGERTAVTDANGVYILGGLLPNSGSATPYAVREVVPAGFAQTTTNPADIFLDIGDTYLPAALVTGAVGEVIRNDLAFGNRKLNPAFSIQTDFSNNDPADTPEETATAGSVGNTFTIVITNTGAGAAQNVIINDLVPAQLTVTNVTATSGVQAANPTLNDNDIQWSLSSLGAGEGVILTVTYSVDADVDSQVVDNTASVSSDEVTTPVTDNDDVQVIENAPLTIQKDFSNNDAEGDTPEETATAGSTGNTFTIVVTNTGISTAHNVMITDVVSAELSVTDVIGTSGVEVANPTLDDNDIEWFLASLGAGESVTLTVTYRVGADVNTQLVSDTANVTSDEVTTPATDSDDVLIVENAPLTIQKDFSNNDPTDTPEETATAGSTGNTFTIVVTNTGLSTADNVIITDVVRAALTVTNVTGTAGVQVANPAVDDNDIRWSLSSLGAGQRVTLTVTYSVGDGVDTQLVNNTAFVSSDEVITPVRNSDDVQVIEDVSLTIQKDFSNNDAGGDTPQETVTAGSTGNTFTIVVINTGLSTADNVIISDVVPAQLTITNVSGTAGAQVANPTLDDNDIRWFLSSLGAGQSVILTVTYSVGADVNTQLVANTASVSSDEVTTPVPDSDDVQVIEDVSLTIQKDFSNNDAEGDTPEESATAGSTGNTFTIVVTNTGTSTADSVVITDVVPAALKVTSVTGTTGVEVANPALDDNDIRWSLSSLGAGESVTLTVTYSVGAGVNTQLVNNSASVSSDDVTTTVTDSDDVQVIENAPLTIQKDFSNNDAGGDTPEETATAGSTGNTFTIVVTNTGISTADNVIITDVVPAQLTVTNVIGTVGMEVADPALDDNDIRWSVGSLGAGQSVTLTVTYSVGAGVNTQSVNNTAWVSSQEVTIPVSDSDDVRVIEDAPLTIQKDFSNNDAEGDTPEETATAGSTGNRFTIVVTNTGISTADNVIITDVVPAQLTVTNVIGTAGVEVANPTLDDNDIRWFLTSLGAGESVTLTVTYSVGAGVNSQLVNNTASVSSEEVTTPVSDSDDVRVIENAPLTIQKDFSNNDADGDTLEEAATAGSTGNTFTIVVTNTGISTAHNVIITDIVSAALTITDVTGTSGVEVANPTFDDNDIEWFLSSLIAGESVTLTVTYSVGADVDTRLIDNTALVSSDEVTTPIADSDDVQITEDAPLTIQKDFSNNDAEGDTPEETATAGSTGNTFTIVVTNSGISTADNVIITDLMPSALKVTNVTGTAGVEVANPASVDNDIQWSLTSLGAGQSVVLTVTYSVGAGVNTKLFNNVASVSSDEVTSPVSDSDDVQVIENAPLMIRTDFSNNDAEGDTPEETATAGSTGNTFTIVVTNTGTSTADHLIITDVVSAELSVTNVTGTDGVEVANPALDDNDIQWSLSSLGAGESVTLTVTYSVGANVDTQLVNNTASVSSNEVTTPVSASDDVQVIENASLTIQKDFSNNDAAGDTPEETATAGSMGHTFTVVVTNTGISTADNVIITDVVPAQLTVTNVIGTVGMEVANPALDDNDIRWSVGSLGAGQSVTLTVTYSVGTGVNTQLVNNTAQVSSQEVNTPVSDRDDVQVIENAPLTIQKDFSNNDALGDTPEETATAGSTGNRFTIVVTNTGISTADNVIITDVVPAQLTVTNVIGTAGVEVANPTLDDNNIRWSLGSLGAGKRVTLTVTYSVGAGVNTQLVSNTARVSSQEITTPIPDSDDVRVIENAPLTIQKDFSRNDAGGDTPEETATAGSTGNTFTIVVTNTGISTADNVIITDVVPAQLTVTNVTGTAGVEVANPALDDNDIRWSLGSLGAKQSLTLTVTYSVAANVNTQLVNNTARVSSQEVTTPVSDSDDMQVIENAPLTIQKDFSSNDAEGDTPEETATTGSTGNTFTIVVTNTGISTADNVIITDVVPAQLTVTNVTGTAGMEAANPTLDDNDVRWLLGSLDAGQSVTLTVTYSVGAGVSAQLVINTASVSSDEVTSPILDSDDVQVIVYVPLTIQRDFSNNDAEGDTPEEIATAGSTGNTFTIVVTNTGIATADSVIITDVVPAQLTVTNVTGTAGVELANPTLDDNHIRWFLDSLGMGQSVTLTVTYSVDAGVSTQLLDNSASVSSQGVITPISDSDDIQIIENAPLTIQTDFSNNDAEGDTPEETATIGSTGNTFTIVVTNTGVSTADNVIITDVVPAQLTVTNVTGTAGVEVPNSALDDNNIQWSLSSLGAGQSVILTVTYSVGADVNTQLIDNTATVSSDEVTTAISDSDDVQIARQGDIVVGADAGTYSQPAVKVFDPVSRMLKFVVKPEQTYGVDYHLGVRVATGDINGDGIPDIVTAPGRNKAPNILVFNGLPDALNNAVRMTTTGLSAGEYDSYFSSTFTSGVYVAVGDVTGDGKNDIVIAPELGVANVVVLQNNGTGAGGTSFTKLSRFNAFSDFPSYIGGASVAVADVRGGPAAEVIVGSGAGLAARVRVYESFSISSATKTLDVLDPNGFRGGVYVAAGNVTGDAKAEIITSSASGTLAAGAGSTVRIYNGSTGAVINAFQAFPATADVPNAAVRVTVRDGQIYAVQGQDGRSQYQVRKIDIDPITGAGTINTIDSFFTSKRDVDDLLNTTLNDFFDGGGLFIG